ncbi:MAG: hypothetical protein E7612_06175 [Ruminococcaceae bacterium]|nr:hypothetical protein [Oscillospiraceae bacterium]
MKKVIIAVLIAVFISPILVFCLLLIGRLNFFIDIDYRSPDNYSGYTWSNYDETIVFKVEEEKNRFRGTDLNVKGTPVAVSPLYANMFGTMKFENNQYDFFFDLRMYDGAIISEELPEVSEEGKFSETYEEYMLVSFSVDYISKKHFVAKVTSSKIPEIEVGEKIHFYQTD